MDSASPASQKTAFPGISIDPKTGMIDPYRYFPFGGSDKSIKPMTPLWRYLTFEKFCSLIETGKLYHARLDQFEDPFEGSVTAEYVKRREADATEHKEEFLAKLEPWTNVSNLFRSYATCWHASDHESDAQWKLYAAGGAGIAVVSSKERLIKSVDLHPYRHGLLGQVEYIDWKNHDMRHRPFGTEMRPGFVKRNSFEHEREVRGVILTDLSVVTKRGQLKMNLATLKKLHQINPPGISVRVDLHELISNIVLSPLAPAYIDELVRIITKRHDLDHLVTKSNLCGSPIF